MVNPSQCIAKEGITTQRFGFRTLIAKEGITTEGGMQPRNTFFLSYAPKGIKKALSYARDNSKG